MEEVLFEGWVYQSKSWYPRGNGLSDYAKTTEEDAEWRSATINGSGVNPGIYVSEGKAWASNGGKKLGEYSEQAYNYGNAHTGDLRCTRRRVVKVKVVVVE